MSSRDSQIRGGTRTALVTGASTGIGYELAKLLAADGSDIILVARTEETLQTVKTELEDDYEIEATVISMDLSVPGSAADLYEAVDRDGFEVETLVNNAGFAIYGHFIETDLEEELEMIQLNLTTLTHLTKLFARDMAGRGHGQILTVSSMAGIFPCPTGAVYSATKHYVLAFSEAIADELAYKGITVTALCPGPTATPLMQRGNLEASQMVRDPMMDAASVAQVGYKGLRQGKRVVVAGRKNKRNAVLKRVLPRKMAVKAARAIWEPADTREADIQKSSTRAH